MAITVRIFLLLGMLYSISGCNTSRNTILICGQQYDVHTRKTFLQEENMSAVFKTVCFKNSHYYLFSYMSEAKRLDSNLVSTTIQMQGDSIIIRTLYDKTVYGYDYKTVRYFRCLPDGIISMATDGNPDFVITKDTARKYDMKFQRKQSN